MIGNISSIETMGLLDGPGIRVVVFMQGCSLRCLFCHNPETWSMRGGISMRASDVIEHVKRYKNYFGDRGGVTFSGGEPLQQPEFLLECLKLCKENGIHTCLDTAGFGGHGYWEEILKYVNLVLLDIKAIDDASYQKMTCQSISSFFSFLDLCQKMGKTLWLRQVIVPGVNDTEDYILKLKSFIQNLKYVEKVELLPYHLMGVEKYEKIGIPYRLNGVPAMDHDKCTYLHKLLIDEKIF